MGFGKVLIAKRTLSDEAAVTLTEVLTMQLSRIASNPLEGDWNTRARKLVCQQDDTIIATISTPSPEPAKALLCPGSASCRPYRELDDSESR